MSVLGAIGGFFGGAILGRELRASGRRRSTYVVRGGYAALFAVVTMAAVGTMLPNFDEMTSAGRVLSMAYFGESLVMFVAWFQFVVVAMVAPAMTSSAICEEKQMGTLSALMTTPLRARQIVVGKLVARVYQVLVLVLISAPMLLAARVFGGVRAEVVLAFTCVTLATALMGGAMGLLFSMWHSRPAPAAIFALMTLGLFFIAPSILYFAMMQTNLFGLGGWLGITVADVNLLAPMGYALSPPIALLALSNEGPQTLGYTWSVGTALDRIWVMSAIMQVVLAAGLVAIGSGVLRRILAREAAGRTERPEPKTAEGKGRRRRRLNRLAWRPIYWREVSRPWIENRFQLGILIFVIVTVFGYAYWRADLDDAPIHMIIGMGGLATLVLLASVQTTGAISGERDAQTWDVLMTTPVSAWRVVLDKYLASLVRLWPLGLAIVGHFVFSSLGGYITWSGSAMIVALAAGAPAMYLATGLLLGMWIRKGVVSSVTNIALVLTLWVGVPVLVLLGLELSSADGVIQNRILMAMHTTSPLALMVSVIDSDVMYDYRGASGRFTLGDDHVTRGTMLAVALGNAGVHLALAGAALALARRHFTRASGRSS